MTDLKTLHVVGNTADQVVEPVDKPLNKTEAFLKFVQANPNAKVLMFSGYDATFYGMEEKLSGANISFANVNGSNARITKMLKDFNAGKYSILFLNARNMGSGLNIDCATHVVLFHRMSSDLEAQIIGRAMRLGRTAPLEVVHLLHENERDSTIQHV
jgi:SNF2 family DNA or RNA helicase